jgi:hypothetical protein
MLKQFVVDFEDECAVISFVFESSSVKLKNGSVINRR